MSQVSREGERHLVLDLVLDLDLDLDQPRVVPSKTKTKSRTKTRSRLGQWSLVRSTRLDRRGGSL